MLTPDGIPASADWSLQPGILHLNHGSFGAVPRAAQAFQGEMRRVMNANPCDWYTDLPGKVAPVRREIAQYLHASPDATALVTNASAGASVVYNNIPAWQGMEIVTTDHAYGAVLMGAQRLARRWAGKVIEVHIPLTADDDDAFDRVNDALSDNTALVVIDQVAASTAKQLPAGRIAAAGRRRGIPVLVDAAHAPGLFAEPLLGIDADFWVGNLHKFACAPPGTAAIVASGSLTQLLYPLIDSWAALEPFPARFDAQGTTDITSFLAAPVALRIVEERYGWDNARQYINQLSDYAESIVSNALSEAAGENAAVYIGSPVIGLRLVRLPKGLATTLDAAHKLRHLIAHDLGIETAITNWRGSGFLRLSAHIYNTAENYEDFVDRAVPFIVELSRTIPSI